MAETQIGDIVIPEVFGPYIMERSLNQSRFFNSGVIVENAQIASMLLGGGKTFNIPFWQDLAGDSGIPSESQATSIANIDTDKAIVRRQIREKAWGSNDLAHAFAGADPFEAIGARVAGYWANELDKLAILTARGVIANNVGADSSDLVVDIKSADGSVTSANKISAPKTIEAVMKQGDRFDEIVAIAVHSGVYATLVTNDLIDFVADSQGRLTIPTYMGLRVIVSDNLPALDGVASEKRYHSYLFKAGALGYGAAAGAIKDVEIDRDPSKGAGIDILYTRRQFGLAPLGFSWVMASDTGISPTDANLIHADSWDRVYDKKNTGVVCIISNG